MNKALSFLTLLAVSCAFIFMPVSGCKNPQQATYTAQGVLITSVDAGMKSWADWVKAGKATQSQVDTVKKAYNDYYAAQTAFKAAWEYELIHGSTNAVSASDSANAKAAVNEAEAALLSLLTQFMQSTK